MNIPSSQSKESKQVPSPHTLTPFNPLPVTEPKPNRPKPFLKLLEHQYFRVFIPLFVLQVYTDSL
ncbi:uncharacterized protein TrAFT101_003456 [Trichoderma asperellum]|uniref:uncharacterized protein n=1 Tax=Trichoderma asperellum TaxID=101201 RepID=UPI003318552D|nr:hypothetical protein TrAFT101_003456 [Trichoderma asperellum]